MDTIYKIAIVGKPNVGKSSLFNALIKKRKSIVDSKPGLTRDVVNEIFYIDDTPVMFLDTGGITKDKHTFIEKITEFAKNTIIEADLVLFVVEVGNIDMDDEYIADYLRKNGFIDKTFLIVNKVDNQEREVLASEAYSLGLKTVFFTSAAHNKGIDVIRDIIKGKARKIDNFSDSEDIRVSIIGRPNVGKSSLLNQLVGKERSIVSDIPGTTIDTVEDVIDYKNKRIKFVDTAGIRRRSKVEEKLEYIMVKRAINSLLQSKISIVLLDALESITNQDIKLINLAIENRNSVIIAINKWDVVKGKIDKKNYFDRIRFFLGSNSYLPLVEISAKDGYNIKKLLDKIISINNEFNKKIQPSEISELLVKTTREKPLFSNEGNFKVYYALQVDTAPPFFKAFVNTTKTLTDAYYRFLLKTIRESLGFKEVPVILEFKEKR
ncbi:MAG TPA: ribosome biogenesis GTPase Der [Spirochaetota bacterium]|nr:ribosome biogenesis GTPase Der [Spirochaetota bacterium]HOM38677.1 ribosome biogenesis GTPase Der [Spirochaetota bacterium]HPQ49808.1 ribosome biogenesis GTPase Der [Spirochaetota bacterium]